MKQAALFDTINPTMERDRILDQVAAKAGEDFCERASAFVLAYLVNHPSGCHGEEITDACKAAGIRPDDDRAFGPVYMQLSRAGAIVKVGYAPRKKGHSTGGGNLWALGDRKASSAA